MSQSGQDLKHVESHFAFGENWAGYARLIGEPQIQAAEQGLLRLLDRSEWTGRRFLDIGCGSGLHALAALRLGCESVLATDIDPKSVETTNRTLEAHATARRWEVRRISVFDLRPETLGTFEVVYSWGVLHHTGAMYEAIERAAAMVAPAGRFCVALYGKTPFCGFWRLEKRYYSHASPHTQARARRWYTRTFRTASRLRGRDFDKYVREYRSERGMDFEHDVHDWLGGYPYESISSREMHALAARLGFRVVHQRVRSRIGLFGSGCDEYVLAR